MAIMGNASSPGRQGFLWIMVSLQWQAGCGKSRRSGIVLQRKEAGTIHFNHGITQRGLRRNHGFWTAAGSEAPRRFWAQPTVRRAVSPLRSATAVQIFVVRARTLVIVLRMDTD